MRYSSDHSPAQRKGPERFSQSHYSLLLLFFTCISGGLDIFRWRDQFQSDSIGILPEHQDSSPGSSPSHWCLYSILLHERNNSELEASDHFSNYASIISGYVDSVFQIPNRTHLQDVSSSFISDLYQGQERGGGGCYPPAPLFLHPTRVRGRKPDHSNCYVHNASSDSHTIQTHRIRPNNRVCL